MNNTPMQELFEKFGHLLPNVEYEYVEKENNFAKQPIANEWVKVEDGLPEKETPVLVLRTNPNVVTSGYIHERGHWVWSNMRGDTNKENALHKITHWMPLPHPPKK